MKTSFFVTILILLTSFTFAQQVLPKNNIKLASANLMSESICYFDYKTDGYVSMKVTYLNGKKIYTDCNNKRYDELPFEFSPVKDKIAVNCSCSSRIDPKQGSSSTLEPIYGMNINSGLFNSILMNSKIKKVDKNSITFDLGMNQFIETSVSDYIKSAKLLPDTSKIALNKQLLYFLELKKASPQAIRAATL